MKYIKRSNIDDRVLYNLVFKKDNEGLIPRHYADPHRPIAKFLNYLEKKLLRKRINERRRFNISQMPSINDRKYLALNDADENMSHKKVYIRYWNDFKSKKMPANFESRLKDHFEDLKMKKRGVSSNASRLKRTEFFAALQPQMSLEFPNDQQLNQFRISSFKTPKKSFEKFRKRMSSFNENKRRPINTLTIPKKGDVISDSGSISSVKSENTNKNFDSYLNNLQKFRSSSPMTKKNPRQAQKLNSKKLGNLECKESNNFSEIGDSIINKKNTTKAIFPSHVLSNPSKMHFDLSEYDDEQMNEKSQNLQQQKRLQTHAEGSLS